MRDAKHLSAGYYQAQHDTNTAYQQNNWLLPHADLALACAPSRLVEIGFGNGGFLLEASRRVPHVTGLDWALSPVCKDMPGNVELVIGDINTERIPAADLICSADVLEHIGFADLRALIPRLHKSAPYNFHIIACYDDMHSHLTIMSPQEWLSMFRAASGNYRIAFQEIRRNDPSQLVCAVCNY